MNELYTTVKGTARAEFEEKRSRFIGTVKNVRTEEEAKEFITAVSEEFGDATHNVFAYYLSGGAHARYSDDGEPQGTAGIPVLEMLKKSGADDVAVVVTRYFGGTKLGAGGLVRAYTEAAKLAIEKAGIVTLRLFAEFTVRCRYPEYPAISSKISASGVKTDSTDYSDEITLRCAVRADRFDDICSLLGEITSGRVRPERTGERYDCDE